MAELGKIKRQMNELNNLRHDFLAKILDETRTINEDAR